ncbi:RNA polymerase sigma factor [Dactylosporangium sp. CS-047395]|uniref:RNA polymerase sigma factor n=1 Tax=Dactylosporangium sp. CS-047395 TaxID=3239936 RepID=UPI003D8FFAF0
MDDLDVEELARRAAGGDGGARDALLARIEPQVMRQCRRILPCPQDAEEACQDALLQVALKISSFDGRSRFSTWLYVVAANCARQTYRTLKRRASEQAVPHLPLDVPDPRTTSVIAGSRLDLLDALEQLEGHRPELVAPLVLRDLCELSYQEIAVHLAIPSGTLKSRIHDARKHVRASLEGGPGTGRRVW